MANPRYPSNTNFAKHLPALSETLRTSSQVFLARATAYDQERHTIDISFLDPTSGRIKDIEGVVLLAQPAGLSSSDFSMVDNFKDFIWIILSPTGADMNTPIAIGMIDPLAVSKSVQLVENGVPSIIGRTYKF